MSAEGLTAVADDNLSRQTLRHPFDVGQEGVVVWDHSRLHTVGTLRGILHMQQQQHEDDHTVLEQT